MDQEIKEQFKEEYDIVSVKDIWNRCLDCGAILTPSGGCYYYRECGSSNCP